MNDNTKAQNKKQDKNVTLLPSEITIELILWLEWILIQTLR